MKLEINAYNIANSIANSEIERWLKQAPGFSKIKELSVCSTLSRPKKSSKRSFSIFFMNFELGRDDAADVDLIMKSSIDSEFIILVNEGLLEANKRQTSGIESLLDSIENNFAKDALLVAETDICETNDAMSDEMLAKLYEKLQLLEKNATIEELTNTISRQISDKPAIEITGLESTKAYYDQSANLKNAIDGLLRLKNINQELQILAEIQRETWLKIVKKHKDEAIKKLTKKTNASYLAYILSLPVLDKLKQLSKELSDENLKLPMIYDSWKEETLALMQKPCILMPVIGIFSSGKTTFINSLFSASDDKLDNCLRTEVTHNTAMLLHITGRGTDTENSVNFSWKTNIEIDIVFAETHRSFGYRSSVNGKIESVVDHDPFVVVNIKPDNDKELSPPIVLKKCDLKHRIKAGLPVKTGDSLIKEDIALSTNVEKGIRRVRIHPYALRSAIEFLKTKILKDPVLQIEYALPDDSIKTATLREAPKYLKQKIKKEDNVDVDSALPTKTPKWKEDNKTKIRELSEQLELLNDLYLLLENQNKNPHTRNAPTTIELPDYYPIGVTLKGKLAAAQNKNTLIERKGLSTNEDWDWFQGDSGICGKQKGFAESQYASWLLERGELKIDNPLFDIVEIVDTPGINSVSPHHDRITFDYINRGSAFIVLIGLNTQNKDEDLALFETFTRVITSFKEKSIEEKDWGERTFIVFNWFHDCGNPDVAAQRVKERIKRFEELLQNIFIQSFPRIYLIDASGNKYFNKEKLLGFPSTKRLIKDLPKLVNQRYLNEKIKSLLERFMALYKQAYNTNKTDINRLKDSDSKRYLEKLKADLEGLANHKKHVHSNVENYMLKIEKHVSDISQFSFDNRNELSKQASSIMAKMKNYNEERNAANQHCGSWVCIQRKYASYKSYYFSNFSDESLFHNIPTFLHEDFKNEADMMAENWPSGFIMGVKWLVGQRQEYIDARNNELRAKYYSQQTIDSMRNGLNDVTDSLIKHVNKEFTEFEEYLKSELKHHMQDSEGRKKRIAELNSEIIELDEFRTGYDAICMILKKTIETN